MRFLQARLLRFAPLGVALAMGGASAHAQNVISRQVVEEPVETTVTQTPDGTVITRRPLGAAPAAPSVGVIPAADIGTVPLRPYAAAPPATYVDETVGAAPAERTVTTRRSATQTTTRVARPSRPRAETANSRTTRSVQRTTTVRRVSGPPLVLDPAQRRIVYRTIVQQQVVPVVPTAPVYPAYPARPVVVPSTTGYGYGVPPDVDDVDDVYAEQETVPSVYPVRYMIGSQLPAGVVLTPLPAATALQVPAIRPYAYVRIGGRVLLVDPATYTVVADITP
jgi:uncharacterized protein DUF1236